MSRPVLLAATLLAFAVAGVMRAQDDGAPQTLRVQVHLVNLFVNVTDAHGAPVPDLEKGNFTVTEDGVQQKISVFEKQTDAPLSVVLAVDSSGSTRKDLNVEQHAARDFAQTLLTPKDQLALFDFNSDVREVVPFTNNVRQIGSGLKNLGTAGGGTAVYQAVYLGSDALAPHSGRKVLIVITDGDNTVNGTSFDEALAEAQRSDVIIYSLIDTPIEADAGRDTAGEHAMIVLSQETGGRYFYVNQGGLQAAFKKVSDDLRTQYLLAYYPHHGNTPESPLGHGSQFHALHVTLETLAPGSKSAAKDVAGDTPHYRSGYFRSATQP